MAKPSGWMRGTVKEVLSGDTLVLAGTVRVGIPPEKKLTLASLMAPRLGRRDGSTADEPFAWQSREFLRKLTIGKPVVFRVEYALEAAGGREFGSVFLEEKENVALTVVSNGWAKVRAGGGQQSPYLEDLQRTAEDAESRGLGMWNKDPEEGAASIRPGSDEFDASGFIAATGKGSSVQAIVEAVLSGSMLRVTLLPKLESAVVMVAGVQCPSLGKRVEAPRTEDESAPSLPAQVPEPEQGAREAKWYTESRSLNREVKLTLEGTSQFGVLVASVGVPVGSSTEHTEDLASSLLKAGLAKGAEWSLNMMVSGAFRLRETERAARQARVGVWKDYVPAPTASTKLSDDFKGVVAEVVSGDCLVVRDSASGTERRVTLSSIRAPRPGGRDRAPEPCGLEAKELLRKTFIGKPVRVVMEYTRKIGAAPSGDSAAALAAARGDESATRLMSFGSVTSISSSADDQPIDAAELVVSRGLASVVRHRADEERAGGYGALVAAEEEAKRGKLGQWGAKAAAPPRINDLTGNPTRAKSHLPFLQRAGKVVGIVEVVLSAHKLKVYVPKEGATLAFSPAGVKCPSRGQPAANGRSAIAEEPFWQEALAFTRSATLQREVELEIDNVDRVGTFLGRLRVRDSKLDLGFALLSAGLARLQRGVDPVRSADLVGAEEAAKTKKLKIWSKVGSSATDVRGEEDENKDEEEKGATLNVVVTDVRDSGTFYVQNAGEPRVSWIAQELAALDLNEADAPKSVLRAGDKCIAKYDLDGQWYRAVVEKAYAADPTKPEYDIVFMDFGNAARVKASDVRPMDSALVAVAPQAQAATLAFVKAPALESEWGVEAAQMLADLVGDGKRLTATVESRERLPATGKGNWGAQAGTKLHLTLRTAADQPSVNAQLVEAGLAKVAVPKSRGSQGTSQALEEVQHAEESARQRRVGIWQYGDPGSDSEDEGAYPKLRSAGPRR